MKDKKNIAIISLGVLLLVSIYFNFRKPSRIGAFSDGSFAQLDGSTVSVTATIAGTPVKLAARNYARSSADICNLSTTSSVEIYFQNFASSGPATPTVTSSGGVLLPTTGCYAIRGSNLYITDVWVASAASGPLVSITEK